MCTSHLTCRLIEIARGSNVQRKHAAAVTKGKAILTMGSNYLLNPHTWNSVLQQCDQLELTKIKPKTLKEIRKRARLYGSAISVHAEELAVLKCRRQAIKRGARSKLKLTVIRVNKSGDIVSSKPCTRCVEIMRNYGFRKVTYSDSEGELITESLKSIVSRPSSAQRTSEERMKSTYQLKTLNYYTST